MQDRQQPYQEIISKSSQETSVAGADLMQANLASLTNRSLLVVLEGDFGTGKTHFVKGIARYLGIADEIVSPSYTYMREYPFSITVSASKVEAKLVHVDAWRMDNIDDFSLLGVETYLKVGNVVAVEWGSGFTEEMLQSVDTTYLQVVHVIIAEVDNASSVRKIAITYF